MILIPLILLALSFVVAAPALAEEAPRPVTEEMVHVPAGVYQQGCDRFGPQHGAPAHRVYLDAFMIDKYEVTNIQFEAVFPEHKLRRSIFSKCDRCPVSKVNWYEAADYCHLVGKALPSEAQWERAAGGKTGCDFPWGPEFMREEGKARGGYALRDGALPVGSYPPNSMGLYDMAGNMWEWVSDWFSIDYYYLGNLYNPRGPADGIMKVRRGGSWSDSVKAMATGYRDWSYPLSRGFNDIGFRCAITLRANP